MTGAPQTATSASASAAQGAEYAARPIITPSSRPPAPPGPGSGAPPGPASGAAPGPGCGAGFVGCSPSAGCSPGAGAAGTGVASAAAAAWQPSTCPFRLKARCGKSRLSAHTHSRLRAARAARARGHARAGAGGAAGRSPHRLLAVPRQPQPLWASDSGRCTRAVCLDRNLARPRLPNSVSRGKHVEQSLTLETGAAPCGARWRAPAPAAHRSGGTVRFWCGLRPLSRHLRAWMMKWRTPPAADTTPTKLHSAS